MSQSRARRRLCVKNVVSQVKFALYVSLLAIFYRIFSYFQMTQGHRNRYAFLTSQKMPTPIIESDFVFQDLGESYAIVGYRGQNENVVIPPKVDGKPVTILGASAFAKNRVIQCVFIPGEITEIGSSCFVGCKFLQDVIFARESNLKKISERAFSGTAIRWMTIPKNVEEIGVKCFNKCRSFEKLTFEGGESCLRIIGDDAFKGCNFREVCLPESIKELCVKSLLHIVARK